MNKLSITICGLSVHWLLPNNAAVLDSMDQNYNCYTVSCSSASSFNGRTLGKGGVALLWHKSIDQYVQTLHIDSDRLIAIKLCFKCICHQQTILFRCLRMLLTNFKIQLPSTKKKATLLLWAIFMLISAPVTCNGSALTFIPYTDASIEGLAEEGCNSHFHQISLFCIVQLTFLRYTLCKITDFERKYVLQ